MKIVCISDTHAKHRELVLPDGDLLIHAGDISRRGWPKEVRQFLTWFASQPHPHKVFIAGNHDFLFEQESAETIAEMIPEGVHYLNDSGVEIEGIKIWGSPVQPWFHDWAFNRQRGAEIQQHWDLIPADTDLLLVHGPPFGILDRIIHGQRVGCENLLATVQKIVPKLCVFGHIHEDYGMVRKGETWFVNASVLDHGYQLRNAPVEIEWPIEGNYE